MRKTLTFRLFIIAVLLIASIWFDNRVVSPASVVARKPLSEFPKTIGQWTVTAEHAIDKGSMEILNVDDYIMWTYGNADNRYIDVYIGYFANQTEGKEIHSPRQCLIGSGWTPIRTSVVQFSAKGPAGFRFAANKYLMDKGGRKDLFIFWYQGRGRRYASEYMNKVYLICDGLMRGRTDGALIRINMDAGADPARAFGIESAFIRQLVPVLSSYIPG